MNCLIDSRDQQSLNVNPLLLVLNMYCSYHQQLITVLILAQFPPLSDVSILHCKLFQVYRLCGLCPIDSCQDSQLIKKVKAKKIKKETQM